MWLREELDRLRQWWLGLLFGAVMGEPPTERGRKAAKRLEIGPSEREPVGALVAVVVPLCMWKLIKRLRIKICKSWDKRTMHKPDIMTWEYRKSSEILVGSPSFIARRLENQEIQG